jgi:hypothetical protein
MFNFMNPTSPYDPRVRQQPQRSMGVTPFFRPAEINQSLLAEGMNAPQAQQGGGGGMGAMSPQSTLDALKAMQSMAGPAAATPAAAPTPPAAMPPANMNAFDNAVNAALPNANPPGLLGLPMPAAEPPPAPAQPQPTFASFRQPSGSTDPEYNRKMQMLQFITQMGRR